MALIGNELATETLVITRMDCEINTFNLYLYQYADKKYISFDGTQPLPYGEPKITRMKHAH